MHGSEAMDGFVFMETGSSFSNSGAGGSSGPSGSNPNPGSGPSAGNTVVNPDESPRRRGHFLETALNGTPLKLLRECSIKFVVVKSDIYLVLDKFSIYNNIQDLQRGPYANCPTETIHFSNNPRYPALKLNNIPYTRIVKSPKSDIGSLIIPNIIVPEDSARTSFNEEIKISPDKKYMTIREVRRNKRT